MGVIITFNYPAWLAMFPEFTQINAAQATMYFNLATQYCRNDGSGPVQDTNTQTNLLNLMTAHIAKLMGPEKSGGRPSSIVGHITNASEGSVSVATENNYPPGTSQWFQQTSYGAAFWQASSVFRTMRYMPGRRRVFNPWRVGLWGSGL